jgi:hypothetical protein
MESAVLMGRRNRGYDDSSNYMGGGTRGMDGSREAVQLSNTSMSCVDATT